MTIGSGTTAGARSAARHRQVMANLRLLCHSGAGLEALAGPLCRFVREVAGGTAGAVFWNDAAGNPAGFFHDCAPPELKDLFVTRFDELFGSPDHYTMRNFIGDGGVAIGKTLAPEFMDAWVDGPIHRHLCVPLDNHHILDMRIDRDGAGFAAFFAWRPERHPPFSAADVALLGPVQRLIETAAKADAPAVKWCKVSAGHGHFITDPSGAALVAMHPEAERFLKDSHLLQQNISVTGRLNAAPSFAATLAQQLAGTGTASLHIPVANGRLAVQASHTRGIGEDGGDVPMMFVALHREVAQNMLAAEYLMALPLTAFQREIALFAMIGGERSACGAELGVSDEALKKHLRAIFAATGATRWADLPGLALPAA